jgi:hypothetical protein
MALIPSTFVGALEANRTSDAQVRLRWSRRPARGTQQSDNCGRSASAYSATRPIFDSSNPRGDGRAEQPNESGLFSQQRQRE